MQGARTAAGSCQTGMTWVTGKLLRSLLNPRPTVTCRAAVPAMLVVSARAAYGPVAMAALPSETKPCLWTSADFAGGRAVGHEGRASPFSPDTAE
jgi:hypothetical protein